MGSITDCYAPYEFERDLGPEPTAEELAAIDAAERPEQIISLDDWARTSWTQTTLRVVGPPDGTAEWRLRFVAELLGYHEAVRRAQDALVGIDIAELDALRRAWDEATHKWHGGGGFRGASIVNKMLGAGLTLRAVASYLEQPAPVVAKYLYSANPVGLLAADDLLRATSPLPWRQVATQTGVSYDAVRRHAERIGARPSQERHWKHDVSLRDRCLELRAEGMGLGTIAKQVAAEFQMERLAKSTVQRYVDSAAKAAA